MPENNNPPNNVSSPKENAVLRHLALAKLVLLRYSQLSANGKELKISKKNQIKTPGKDETLPEKDLQLTAEEKVRLSAEEIKALSGMKDPAPTPDFLLGLATRLINADHPTYARRILARAAHHPDIDKSGKKLKIYQQWALATYKDLDSPADLRFKKALDILKKIDLKTTTNQETLGLGGAIYKRMWEIENQKVFLESALLYYRKGFEQGCENDRGYTGINAAFIHDQLAHLAEEEAAETGQISDTAKMHRGQSEFIRRKIIEHVEPVAAKEDGWWLCVTVAEAYFGLKEYPKATEWLRRGMSGEKEIAGWEKESTIRQLARLAITQIDARRSPDERLEDSAAWKALSKAFGGDPEAIRAGFMGKIGLALSGGGFRASLFHIGTLAKLAELGVLRHVEVLSCVSGGSIIGAHYYLEVQRLLETTPDKSIDDADYVEIVRKIKKEFLDGVKNNIRMQIATGMKSNVKMLFSRGYTRSTRLGELYESEIFSKVGHIRKNRICLEDLKIKPFEESSEYRPNLDNWRRKTKVPILVLNATTLNTGHNWQFTATWMGEPPSSISADVDTNDQLRRMYYREAPGEYKNSVTLGEAVAASSCVPGVFDAVSLENLYPERAVRLVDGGVCDNQGISSLIEQDCSVILVSDASGQMESQEKPSNGLIGVLLRSNTILQARIRDAQYHDLERRRRSSLLRELMFVHLKEGLRPDPINWIDCGDPFTALDDLRLLKKTNYRIHKDIQKHLASIRTDLDAFSDVEAYALMTSAYRMTEAAFEDSEWIKGFTPVNVSGEPWKFLDVECGMTDSGQKLDRATELLSVGGSLTFRVWRMRWRRMKKRSFIEKTISIIKWATVILLALGCCALLAWSGLALWTTGSLPLMIAGAVIGLYLLAFIILLAAGWKTLSQVLIGIIINPLGWGVSHTFLRYFHNRFLKRGSIDSF